MSLSIERKISLFVLVALIVTISIIAVLFSFKNKENVIENEKKILSLQAERLAEDLEREFVNLKQDVRYLADSKYLSSYVNSVSAEAASSEIRQRKELLEKEFNRLFSYRDSYIQIKLTGIKGHGQETIQTDRSHRTEEQGKNKNVDKIDRYTYIYEASKLAKEEIYISTLKSDGGHGLSDAEKIPVITFSKPVYSNNKQLFGILSISIDFTDPLKHLSTYLNDNEHFLIGMPNGNYVLHVYEGVKVSTGDSLGDKNKNMIRTEENEIPDFFLKHIQQHSSNTDKPEIVTVQKIIRLGDSGNYTIILGKGLDKVGAGINPFLEDSKYTSIPIILLTVAVTLLFSGLPLRQLKYLGNVINDIAAGKKKSEDLPVTLNNEVGDLSRSFNALLNKVESRERELKLAKDKLELAIAGASEGLWDWDVVNYTFDVSDRYMEMLGYRKNELVINTDSLKKLVHPDDVERLMAFTDSYIMGKEKKYEIEFRMKHRDGHYVDILSKGSAVRDDANNVIRLIGINSDITEKKNEVKKLIEYEQLQKKTLVREVHHRIKNNLQGVASLLRQNLEKSELYEGELNTAITQIYAVAMVYGIQGKGIEGVIYIEALLNKIVDITMDISGIEIELNGINKFCKYIVEDAEAVPLALILNELVTNACKYSQGGNKVIISIVCNWCGNESISIEIQNKSKPLPDDFNIMEKRGIRTGLRLVLSLLAQEGARLTIREQDGVCSTNLLLSKPVVRVDSGWEYLKTNQV